MTQKTGKNPIKRMLMLAFGCAFLASTSLSLFRMFTAPPPEETAGETSTETLAIEEQLKATEAGYEKVLAREPENRFALQGLVEIRLQMNDLKGAIAPLEKLIELDPNNENLLGLLLVIKEKAEQEQIENRVEQKNEN
ncbi:MAG: hypothetical protein DSM107014_08865 [Gomphosphaeria aponina SAG 52.96 = DSM 107014]|uniref:Tetratricopeptide repeat protein n=1 Tax=Gomphosphaeria aponina SAG 52.96 = DSM 107014 TaxID=1521640 RepID=A0A941JS73_9CHRO|nr:hypothetical protein [Gomphosphaeria aponina SAG 52.96 = DSM 107014]